LPIYYSGGGIWNVYVRKKEPGGVENVFPYFEGICLQKEEGSANGRREAVPFNKGSLRNRPSPKREEETV